MSIVTLIEGYGIEVKKQGQLYVALCPFHDDKNTPNLMIYPKTNSWYCFACNHGGDEIQFISLIEHKDRKEVEKTYRDDIIDRDLESFGNRESTAIHFKDEVLIITSQVCRDFLQKHPDKTAEVLSVCKKLDAKLATLPALDYTSGMAIVDKFKKFVYSI